MHEYQQLARRVRKLEELLVGKSDHSEALAIEGLTVAHGKQAEIFRDVSINLQPGRSLAVLGASGSGKTTLLLTILGLLKPKAGRIWISGNEITVSSARARARIRREHLGAVFQSGELLPELTARENVALPALLAGRPAPEALERAEELLTRLGVGAADRPIGTYSGGERQRVAVSRALINAPSLVVADEPTGSLDEDTSLIVQDLLFEVPKLYDCGLIVVTHDRTVSARADTVIRLVKDGDATSHVQTDRH